MLLVSCVIILSTLISGCGTLGETYARKVDLAKDYDFVVSRATVGQVRLDEGAALRHTAGAWNLGGFKDTDLSTLESTLRATLDSYKAKPVGRVHVRVRHIKLAYSNVQIQVFGVVDWCLESANAISYKERFYTAFDSGSSVFHLTTLGAAKQKVINAIVKRISERSLSVLNQLDRHSSELTFDEADLAKNSLSGELVAKSAPGALGALVFFSLGGGNTSVELLPEYPIESIDWEQAIGVNAPR